MLIISDTSTILFNTGIASFDSSVVLALCSSIVQTMVVVQVLRTDERCHRSYVLSTIHVLLDLNNVFIYRLYAFDVLKVAHFHLSLGLSTSGLVICVPRLSSFNFVFSFLLRWS